MMSQTPFGALSIDTIPLVDSDESLFAIRSGESNDHVDPWPELWQTLNRLGPTFGVRAVLTLHRPLRLMVPLEELTDANINQAVLEPWPEAVLLPTNTPDPRFGNEDLAEQIASYLQAKADQYQELFNTAPTVAEIKHAKHNDGEAILNYGAAEYWLDQWARRTIGDQQLASVFSQPNTPWPLATSSPGDQICAVLLPDHGPATGAALQYFGLEGLPNTKDKALGLARLLRQWRNRYEADLVASWGTTLSLTARRPPTTIDEALLLALEHGPLDDHRSGRSIWEQAYALVNQPHWTLNIKP